MKDSVINTAVDGSNDLMFSTEVDTAAMDFSRHNQAVSSMQKVDQGKLTAMTDDHIRSTKMSDRHGADTAPYDAMPPHQLEEFKDVLKELINRDEDTSQKLEERIIARMKKQAQSRGWSRPSGIKIAPLRILSQLQTQ